MLKDALFIVNPNSGVGRHKIIEKKADALLSVNFHYDIMYTKAPKHATDLTIENRDAYKCIVAVGGDGTVNEVSKALIHSNCTLGIIPTGSGNGLARELKIPLNIDKAILNIQRNQSRHIDTASINGKHFVNVAGLGFDAKIGAKFADFGKRGPLPYIYLALREYARYEPKRYTIHCEGLKHFKSDAFLISFANSTQYGNNAHIAPKAILDDGKIDIIAIKPFPQHSILNIGFRLFLKNLHKSRFIKTYSCSEAIVEMPLGSYDYHADGEPFKGEGDLKVVTLQRALKVICP